jgi:hypothetical protein
VGLRNVFLSLRPYVPILPAGWPVTSASSTARMSSSKPRSKLPRRRRWRLSTLDLFDGRLILCWSVKTAPGGAAPSPEPEPTFRWLGLVTGRELTDLTGELDRSYQLGASGAVLVRPDGYVAWRCEAMPADPVGARAHRRCRRGNRPKGLHGYLRWLSAAERDPRMRAGVPLGSIRLGKPHGYLRQELRARADAAQRCPTRASIGGSVSGSLNDLRSIDARGTMRRGGRRRLIRAYPLRDAENNRTWTVVPLPDGAATNDHPHGDG